VPVQGTHSYSEALPTPVWTIMLTISTIVALLFYSAPDHDSSFTPN